MFVCLGRARTGGSGSELQLEEGRGRREDGSGEERGERTAVGGRRPSSGLGLRITKIAAAAAGTAGWAV